MHTVENHDTLLPVTSPGVLRTGEGRKDVRTTPLAQGEWGGLGETLHSEVAEAA
jgi:hypothetical protein